MTINIIYSFSSLFFKALLSLGVFFVLARILSVEDYGVVSLAYSLSIICSALADYGYNFLVLKEINKRRIENVFWKIMLQKTCVAVCVFLLVFAFIWFSYGTKDSFLVVLLISLSGIFFSFSLYNAAAIKAINIFIDEVKILGMQVVVLSLILAWAYVDSTITALSFAIALLMSRVCGVLYSFTRSYKHFPKGNGGLLRIEEGDQRFIFREGSIYGLHVVFATAYFQVDTQIIGYFSGGAAAGFYQNVIRLIVIGVMVSDVLMQVFLPTLVKVYMNSHTNFVKLASIALNVLTSCAILYITLLTLFSEKVVGLLYGDKYLEVAGFVWVVTLVVYMRCLGSVYGLSLSLSDKPVLRVFAVFLAFVVSASLNYLLVPEYGYEASFYISILAHIILNFIYIYTTYKLVQDSLINRGTLLFTAVLGALAYGNYAGEEAVVYVAVVIPFVLAYGVSEFMKFREMVRLL